MHTARRDEPKIWLIKWQILMATVLFADPVATVLILIVARVFVPSFVSPSAYLQNYTSDLYQCRLLVAGSRLCCGGFAIRYANCGFMDDVTCT